MNKPVNRDLVYRLLGDTSLSYREIARRAGCSDWSVRAIAHELAFTEETLQSTSYQPEQGSLTSVWLTLGSVIGFFILAYAFTNQAVNTSHILNEESGINHG